MKIIALFLVIIAIIFLLPSRLKYTILERTSFGLGGKDYRWQVTWLEHQKMVEPGDYGRKIEVDGVERFYQFHVPKRGNPSLPVPIVLVLHGGGGYPGAVRYQTDFDALGDREGFVAVFPAGTGERFRDRLLTWNDGRTYKESAPYQMLDDVKFISRVLDDLEGIVPLDKQRVYVTGISNGGHMAYRLGAELSNRIAAIAPVGASRIAGTYGQAPKRPISIIHFHGKLDTWDKYDGGYPPSSAFQDATPSAREDIESWVAFNGCAPKPAEVVRRGNASIETYSPCRDNEEIVFVTLEDGGHTWPGGKVTRSEKIVDVGPINTDINSVAMIWDFFKKHKLPE